MKFPPCPPRSRHTVTVHPLHVMLDGEYAHLRAALNLLARRRRPAPTAQLAWLALAERRVRAACAAARAGGPHADVVHAADDLLAAIAETTAVVVASAAT